MAVKIDCPRCKTSLQVPEKLAGGYVNCPRCKGSLWVARDLAAKDIVIDAVSAQKQDNTASVTTAPTTTEVSQPLSVTPMSGFPQAPMPPLPPVPRKKVARFITAEATDSMLRLASDGKLPELHLEEGQAKQKTDAGARSIHPLLLLGILSMSIMLSIAMVIIGGDSPVANSRTKAIMRQKIEDAYFGLGNLESRDLEPYQVELREARQAYSHGDYKAERKHYRKVLDMLRAERRDEDRGLTGSHAKDRELEEALTVLLSGG